MSLESRYVPIKSLPTFCAWSTCRPTQSQYCEQKEILNRDRQSHADMSLFINTASTLKSFNNLNVVAGRSGLWAIQIVNELCPSPLGFTVHHGRTEVF